VHDGWRVVDDDDYNQSVGKLQAESMMSTAASFSLSKKPRFNRSGEEKIIRLKVMQTGLITLQQGRR
jgi:hypothetical protein